MKNAIFFIAASAIFTSAWAGNVQIQVLDRDGKPVPDAVVVVYPSATTGAAPSLLQPSPTIEQERMRFVPAVTVVMPGSTVRFTNQDRWDHHVRGNPTGAAAAAAPAAASSNFELRLAGKADGKPASFADVKLDTPGVVLLGCHLHGSMRGHVFVTDSAWTLKTDTDGIARFASVPDGAAQVRVWHAEQLVDLPRKALNVVPGATTVSAGTKRMRSCSMVGLACSRLGAVAAVAALGYSTTTASGTGLPSRPST